MSDNNQGKDTNKQQKDNRSYVRELDEGDVFKVGVSAVLVSKTLLSSSLHDMHNRGAALFKMQCVVQGGVLDGHLFEAIGSESDRIDLIMKNPANVTRWELFIAWLRSIKPTFGRRRNRNSSKKRRSK